MSPTSFRRAFLAGLLVLVAAASGPARAAPASPRKAVLAALREKEPEARRRALERALDGADSRDAALLVLDVVLPRARGEIEATIGVFTLAQMEDGEALLEIAKRAASGDLRERTLAIEALGRSAAGLTADSALVPLLGDDDPRIRAAAVTALGERHGEGLEDLLVESLEDEDWTVVSAAVTALARQGKESALPHLAATLRRFAADPTGPRSGRIVDDCAVSLAALSGQRFGADVARYEGWWRAKNDLADTGEAPIAAPPESFRSPLLSTRSRRVLFILCTGETMEEKVDPARVSKSIRLDLAEAGDDLIEDLDDAQTKLAIAQIHLRAMLRSLGDGVDFDVLTYASSTRFAFGDLTPADGSTRRKAESRIARLSPSGGGNLEEALRRAFDPKGKDPLGVRGGPDTVVLLSDGHLREPGDTDRLAVSQAVRRWNRVRQVRFLVVAVGQSDSSVLGPLASGPPRGASTDIP